MVKSIKPKPQNPPDKDRVRKVQQEQRLADLHRRQKDEHLALLRKHNHEQQELLRRCRELSIDDPDDSLTLLPQDLRPTPPCTPRGASIVSSNSPTASVAPVRARLDSPQIEYIDLTSDDDDAPLTSTRNKYSLARTSSLQPTSNHLGLHKAPSSVSKSTQSQNGTSDSPTVNECISASTKTNSPRPSDATQQPQALNDTSSGFKLFTAATVTDLATTRSNVQVKALEGIRAARKASSSQHVRSRSSTIQASPRKKRTQSLQPDICPEIPVSTFCNQQTDRSDTLKPPALQARDPTLLLLEKQKREGSFVSRAGRNQSYVPELGDLNPSTRKLPSAYQEKNTLYSALCKPKGSLKDVERAGYPESRTSLPSIPAVEPKSPQLSKNITSSGNFKIPPVPATPRSGSAFSSITQTRSTREESILSHVSTRSAFSQRSSTGRKRKDREIDLSDGESDYRPSPTSSPSPEPRWQRPAFAKPALPVKRTKVVNKYGFLEPVDQTPQTPPSKSANRATPRTPSTPVRKSNYPENLTLYPPSPSIRAASARPFTASFPRPKLQSSPSPLRPKRQARQDAENRITQAIHEQARYDNTSETERMQLHEEERGAGLRASTLECTSKSLIVKISKLPETSVRSGSQSPLSRGPSSLRSTSTETLYTTKDWMRERLSGDRYLAKNEKAG